MFFVSVLILVSESYFVMVITGFCLKNSRSSSTAFLMDGSLTS
jgi:hypothetical protein